MSCYINKLLFLLSFSKYIKESSWEFYNFSFGYNRFFNGFGDIVLFVDVRSVSFEVDIFTVQPPFCLDTVYFVIRANYTNFDIILKLKLIYYVLDDREVFVFLRTNDEIPKGITYSFINYKDYPPDYPSISLIIVPVFF